VILDIDMVEDQILPDYHEYYGFIELALFFFCGIVVPEILVADRRSGMLHLYLSTPLERWSYLSSKALGVMVTLTVITVGPVLFLLLAYTIEGSGPDGVLNWLKIGGQILAAGAVLSAVYGAASLAAASLTDRRAFASIGVIVLLLGTNIVSEVLVETADMSPRVFAVNISDISAELKDRIYGVEPEVNFVFDDDSGGFGAQPPDPDAGAPPEPDVTSPYVPEPSAASLSTLFVVGANALWVALGAGVVWWRYRRLASS